MTHKWQFTLVSAVVGLTSASLHSARAETDPLVISAIDSGQVSPARLRRGAASPADWIAARGLRPVRQATNTYGGGFIELLMTGAAPGPGIARTAAPPAAAMGMGLGLRPMTAAPLIRQRAEPSRLAYAPSTPAPRREIDPRFQRQEVEYTGPHRPGTLVIDTPNKYLYLVQAGGRALRYGIGVGRPGFEWSGVKSISRKAEWPDWTPPPEMLLRRPDLPQHMDGGPDNPLGARAMYLGSSLYRIHGTNEPGTIGTNVSSGCIRLTNDDVTDLYDRVRVGAKVVVL